MAVNLSLVSATDTLAAATPPNLTLTSPFVCVIAVMAFPLAVFSSNDGKGLRVTVIIPFSSDTEETYCPSTSASPLFKLFIALVIAL